MVSNEVKYHCSIDTELADLPDVTANTGKLIQVFTNILINGGQAMEENGQLTVKTQQQDNNVLITISDTGKGIPQDILDKIFNPFFTTKAVGEGTGLGLSICYDIIQEHAGDIRVDSIEGKGTTFVIELPIVKEAETA